MVEMIAASNCHSPDREGVMAKSKWGRSTPAAMGTATTLYATAHDKFWWTFVIVACARSSASTTCSIWDRWVFRSGNIEAKEKY